MDTDNQTGSESSIEDRLAAALGPEPEVAEPAAEEVEVSEVEVNESDELLQPEAAAEWAEIEADDGTKHKVPAALRDGYLRQQDYTRKTMAAANLAKAAQDRLHYAEAREQFTAQVVEEVGSLKALEAQLKQFEGLDYASLYASDPGSALRLRDQRDELRRQIDDKRQAIGQKARQVDQLAQMHSAKQWEMAVEGVKQRIGSYTPGEDAAMLKQVEALGFTLEEIRGRYADPRILHALYKAAKWDVLQANKSQAVNKAQQAPPVLKPGAHNPGAAADRDVKDARMRLKKSGRMEDAAALFLRMK